MTHCVHFFLSHLVQLLFCMMPHWPHVFIFDLILHFYPIVCNYYFDCCPIKGFYKIFLQSYFGVSQWANCFLPHRAKFLFWMVPHRAHLYNSFSDGGWPNLQHAIYLTSTTKGIYSLCPIVCIYYSQRCPIVFSYYFEWCPINAPTC